MRSHTERPVRRADLLYPHVLGLATHLILEPIVGADYLKTALWLRDFSGWAHERRLAWQQEQLRGIVGFARAQVPFYRQLLGPEGDVSLADLPVVDKATIRADMGAFVPAGWERMRHLSKRTGGTTGDPWLYPLDKDAWKHMYGAVIHFWERTGYRYGERLVLLGTPPSLDPKAHSWKGRLRHRVERRTVSVAGIDIGPSRSAVRAVSAGAARGALWYGYAGTVAAMAEAVLRDDLHVPGPRAIVTTSESLLPAWRKRIEEAFGAPIFDQYGCNDGGVLAQSCRRGRYHLAGNVSIVEVLDGEKACPPGIEGDVVVTNLHARVLPFIRYKVGDRAVLGEGPCPCGETGPTLARLGGRDWDQIKLPGGRVLSSMAMLTVFLETNSVLRWQVVQLDPQRLKVRLEVDAGFNEEEEMLIRRSVTRRCGDDVRVEVTTAEPIERTATGKHRAVIRLFE